MKSANCCNIIPRDKTKLRNKNYNAILNPGNEIFTVEAVEHLLDDFAQREQRMDYTNKRSCFSWHNNFFSNRNAV